VVVIRDYLSISASPFLYTTEGGAIILFNTPLDLTLLPLHAFASMDDITIDTLANLASSGQHFIIFAALGFGVGITEMIAHLPDDYRLIRDWRWAHLSYFGARSG
jgi:hypothetical protein